MTAFSKTWQGATGDYELASNWAAISVRNSSYAWTASGSGTNEYYLRTSGGADPGFGATPSTVQINGTNATEGTVGSLTAGQWDYGDNDTLGYSTIYVRLSGGGDPDAQDADHITFRQIPLATDHVRIPAGSGSISSNLDQSGVAIGDFIVEAGYTGSIGTSTSYLRIDPDRFEFEASGGTAYINIGTAAISATIKDTGTPNTGLRGLYLLGSAIATLTIIKGYVGLASRSGETSTATTVRNMGASANLWLGKGAAATTVQNFAGESRVRISGTVTTLDVLGGTCYTEEAVVVTTANVQGGSLVSSSTGTVTTLNIDGGAVDLTQNGAARTVTTCKLNTGRLRFGKNITFTNKVDSDDAAQYTASKL